MATFGLYGKTFYIDDRLKTQLDKKVVPDLKKKDKDAVFVIDGEERSGKSVFAQGSIGAYLVYKLGTRFNLSNICMNPEELRKKIEDAPKNSLIIYDEAHRGMGSTSALSEVNKILKDLMMEMGQRNLIVLVVLPTYFLLERYVALFRARGLFHIYERKGKRGFWVYFNKKNKQYLYMRGKKEFNYNCMKYPMFRGRFTDKYLVDEKEYRKKKADSFKKRRRLTKDVVYQMQRDILILDTYKREGSISKTEEYLKKIGIIGIKHTQIYTIVSKLGGTSP